MSTIGTITDFLYIVHTLSFRFIIAHLLSRGNGANMVIFPSLHKNPFLQQKLHHFVGACIYPCTHV